MKTYRPNLLGIVEHNKTNLPIGSLSFSREDLEELVCEGGILFWSYLGHVQVLRNRYLAEMLEYLQCVDTLKKLGRASGVSDSSLEFTWDQTISLEEYLNQLGQSLDGQTQDKPG